MPAIVRAPHAPRRSDPAMLALLRQRYADARVPLDAVREAVLADVRRGGVALATRNFAAHWDRLVAGARASLLLDTAKTVSLRRLELLGTEIARRYPDRHFSVRPQSAVLAMHQVLTRTRVSGDRRWSLRDARWPLDAYITRTFVNTVNKWAAQAYPSTAPSGCLHASGAAAWLLSQKKARAKRPKLSRVGKTETPRIDPTFKKFRYPFEAGETDIDPEDLVKQALDTVVVARGEFYIATALRDLAREVDHMTALTESGQVPMIIGWRWTLSSAHDRAPSSPDQCDVYAETDVGHPYGDGVYFDVLLPESHPNCWCNIEAVWARAEDLDDPRWVPPEPDDDYKERVREMVEQFHPMLAA